MGEFADYARCGREPSASTLTARGSLAARRAATWVTGLGCRSHLFRPGPVPLNVLSLASTRSSQWPAKNLQNLRFRGI